MLVRKWCDMDIGEDDSGELFHFEDQCHIHEKT